MRDGGVSYISYYIQGHDMRVNAEHSANVARAVNTRIIPERSRGGHRNYSIYRSCEYILIRTDACARMGACVRFNLFMSFNTRASK